MILLHNSIAVDQRPLQWGRQERPFFVHELCKVCFYAGKNFDLLMWKKQLTSKVLFSVLCELVILHGVKVACMFASLTWSKTRYREGINKAATETNYTSEAAHAAQCHQLNKMQAWSCLLHSWAAT